MVVYSECVAFQSLVVGLFACRRLDHDCRYAVASWLPLRVHSTCVDCGLPIVLTDEHGRLSFSVDCTYSHYRCRWCCFRECG